MPGAGKLDKPGTDTGGPGGGDTGRGSGSGSGGGNGVGPGTGVGLGTAAAVTDSGNTSTVANIGLLALIVLVAGAVGFFSLRANRLRTQQ